MIHFKDENHIYHNDDGVIYDSPSKIFAAYKNKFDAKKVAQGYARKYGFTAKYWLRKWAETRDRSLDRGTGIHNEREEVLLGRGVDRSPRGIKQVVNPALYFNDHLIDLPDGIYPEINIGNHGWRIAGRPDKITITTLPSGGRIVDIEDYKTNYEIKMNSRVDFYTQSPMMMKPPLTNIMDASFWHYALQMSFYMYILETHGFTPGKMTIIHIPHPFQGVMGETIQPPDKPIEVPYLKKEVLATLLHYNRTRQTERI